MDENPHLWITHLRKSLISQKPTPTSSNFHIFGANQTILRIWFCGFSSKFNQVFFNQFLHRPSRQWMKIHTPLWNKPSDQNPLFLFIYFPQFVLQFLWFQLKVVAELCEEELSALPHGLHSLRQMGGYLLLLNFYGQIWSQIGGLGASGAWGILGPPLFAPVSWLLGFFFFL